jgi:hypothetical protein
MSFIVNVFFDMQVHYYGGKETFVHHGTHDISFVVVFVAMRMSVHLANVGLYAIMLTFGVATGFFHVNFLQLLLL